MQRMYSPQHGYFIHTCVTSLTLDVKIEYNQRVRLVIGENVRKYEYVMRIRDFGKLVKTKEKDIFSEEGKPKRGNCLDPLLASSSSTGGSAKQFLESRV